MAEGTAVTDTHPLIAHMRGKRLGLSPRVAAHFEACERQEAITYIPMAVVWEVSVLVRSFKITLTVSVEEFFEGIFTNPAYQQLDVSLDQVFAADGLRINRDPFDGLIAAAAVTLGLPLITRDTEIEQSRAVKILW